MGFFSFLSGGSSRGGNAADAAMPYLNQIPGVGKQYYEPYINAGREVDPFLRQQYERQYSDPYAILNEIMGNYQPSAGYQFKKNLLSKEYGNNAAAGGYRGTDIDQLQQGQLISGLLGEDMQQYLQNVGNIKERGLGGYENISNRGYESSGALADFLGSNLSQQGSLAFQGAAQRSAQKSALINALLSAGAQGAGAYFGGKGLGQGLSGLGGGGAVPGSFKTPVTTSYTGKSYGGLFGGGR